MHESLSVEWGIESDAFRLPEGTGAYEWWYFDLYDSDRQIGMVAIWFVGIPFSGVRQRSARDASKGGKADSARNFPAVAFSLYGPRHTIAYMANLHPATSLQTSSDPLRCRIGNNEARYHDGRYELLLDDTLLDGGKLEGHFSFSPRALVTPVPRQMGVGAQAAIASEHQWIVAAPRCDVVGRVSCGPTSYDLSGLGYHDHNLGTRPPQNQFSQWEWGRAAFGDRTIIYYGSTGHDGKLSADLVAADDSSPVLAAPATLDRNDSRRNIYGLRYASRLEVRSSAGAISVHQKRVVDNGPFYMRFLSSFEDARGERATGFSEVFRPRALGWRWFWPLLDSRVRPAGSGDLVGRRITQWLIRRGL